jgi:hypothetical protein
MAEAESDKIFKPPKTGVMFRLDTLQDEDTGPINPKDIAVLNALVSARALGGYETTERMEEILGGLDVGTPMTPDQFAALRGLSTFLEKPLEKV